MLIVWDHIGSAESAVSDRGQVAEVNAQTTSVSNMQPDNFTGEKPEPMYVPAGSM